MVIRIVSGRHIVPRGVCIYDSVNLMYISDIAVDIRNAAYRVVLRYLDCYALALVFLDCVYLKRIVAIVGIACRLDVVDGESQYIAAAYNLAVSRYPVSLIVPVSGQIAVCIYRKRSVIYGNLEINVMWPCEVCLVVYYVFPCSCK